MVTDKQRANLAKGRAKGIKRGKQNRAVNGQSWADLIRIYGDTQSDIEPTKTWKQVVVSAAYRQAALGNAAILRELMQRSEPQEQAVRLSGALNVFNFSTIDRLLATRPAGDPGES